MVAHRRSTSGPNLLEAAGKALLARRDEFVPLVIAETGCTATLGKAMQVPQAAVRFQRYARGVHEPTVLPLPPQEMQSTPLAPGGLINAIARRQPVGVVACITSYNFPIVNMVGKIAPALAMGNTVIVRPAGQDPLAIVKLVKLLEDVGFPPGVVNIVTGSTPESGEALVASPDVDMVSFTGSSGVGARIGEVAGRGMKRQLLELGGKGGALVLDDADVKNAIGMIGSVWTFHAGQICTAPTRAIVHRSIYDHVVEGLAKMATVLKVGDPLERDTVIGPVITESHRARIEGYIASGGEEGGEIVAGGGRPAHMDKGWYVEPTLIAGARGDMKVVQEEIFGPVIVALPFDDDDEGIALANGTEFGLYDYVFSERPGARDGGQPPDARRQHRDQHGAAQPGDAVRRHQAVGRRARRRLVRAPRVLRPAVRGLAVLMEFGIFHSGHVPVGTDEHERLLDEVDGRGRRPTAPGSSTAGSPSTTSCASTATSRPTRCSWATSRRAPSACTSARASSTSRRR